MLDPVKLPLTYQRKVIVSLYDYLQEFVGKESIEGHIRWALIEKVNDCV